MKRNTIISIILFVLFFIFINCLYYCNKKHYIKCDSYSQEYFDWLPYKKGDKIIFSDDTINKVFIVNDYTPDHTDQYEDKVKCGCCEDDISSILLNDSDTLTIILGNIGPNKSCKGPVIFIDINNKQTFIINKKEDLISMQKKNEIESNDFKIVKKKGLVKIKLRNKVWRLKES